jgi:Carboxypeptidase regulatory-like domain/TonB dependent receptor
VVNRRYLVVAVLLAVVMLCFSTANFGQDAGSARGSMSGVVLDPTKSLVPGAQVTATGPISNVVQTTNEQGSFAFSSLIPGIYTIKVQKTGFRLAEVRNVEVLINRTTSVEVDLETGEVTQVVEVSGGAITVDTTSSSINSNFSDSFYENIPVQRNVASLFYLAPGVVSGLGTGNSNPAISGGSGLENLYVADGVMINDPAYGGMGVWSRSYGALGTGINLSFVKEVQVKTAAFEPQYGHSTGGIVQIVTKSGGTATHGVVGGFFNSRGMQDTFINGDDTQFSTLNKFGRHLEDARFEADAELGGYVPLGSLKNKLFYFGTFNPTWNYAHWAPAVAQNGTPSGLYTLYNGDAERRTLSLDYAAKLTFKINDSNTIESSVFGDPNTNNAAPYSTLNSNNASANSSWNYGTRNWAVRYDGVITPTLTIDAAFSWSWNHFTETAATDIYQVVDQTQTAGLPGQLGQFNAQGLGFSENYDSSTRGYNFDVAKVVRFLGNQHTISFGGLYQTPHYDDITTRSGPRFAVPTANADGVDFLSPAARALIPAGATTNATFSLNVIAPGDPAYTTCTLCPYMDVPGYGTTPGSAARVFLSQTRGTYSSGVTTSTGKYMTSYINDSWEMGKHVTLNVGLRWEQQRINGNLVGANFGNMWDPRASFIVDPKGDRKTKIYTSFARLPFVLPLDAALRSLSSESDDIGTQYAPQSDANGFVTLNSLGTVNVNPSNAYVLDAATGGLPLATAISAQSGAEPFQPGIRMEYNDEWVVGAEHEFRGGIFASVRYIDRRLDRVVEDFSGVSIEAAFAGIPQNYVIGNPNASTDLLVNANEQVFGVGTLVPKASFTAANFPQCFDSNGVAGPNVLNLQNSLQAANNSGYLGSACFRSTNEPTTWSIPDPANPGKFIIDPNAQFGGQFHPDGKPDGFSNPTRTYQAVEIEVRKDLSHNWAINANWRIARLQGNYEGAFRNDNNQADPGITSLFDFTPGLLGTLGFQQAVGILNADRKHVVNVQTTYILDRTFLKKMVFGASLNVQSGVPLSTIAAQQAYVNSGEVPIFGRGDLGRSPVTGTINAHLEYPFKLGERMQFQTGIDLFNIANCRRETLENQDVDLQFGVLNADFTKALRTDFVAPFQARGFFKLVF